MQTIRACKHVSKAHQFFLAGDVSLKVPSPPLYFYFTKKTLELMAPKELAHTLSCNFTNSQEECPQGFLCISINYPPPESQRQVTERKHPHTHPSSPLPVHHLPASLCFPISCLGFLNSHENISFSPFSLTKWQCQCHALLLFSLVQEIVFLVAHQEMIRPLQSYHL